MSETIDGKQVFSLYEVSKSIQKTIMERYSSTYWIKAEIIKLNLYKHSGHCYPDLVEKIDGKVVAQIRSTIWRLDFIRINNAFIRTLQEPLKEGIKVLIAAKISYSPEHGITLNIQDIDPNYTLGDLEKEKQSTIQRLKNEGLFFQNKALKLPLLPQRIAIISVETSKGYADFTQVLHAASTQWGYCFFLMLFPSLLQGEGAVKGIIQQLNNISKVKEHFDLVVIVRGGGADLGLSCYNNYDLAREIATFPLPIITGIGHSTNETVAEMVAFQDAITPTKLAELLIQSYHNVAVTIQQATEIIKNKIQNLLASLQQELYNTMKLFRSITQGRVIQSMNILSTISRSIVHKTLGFLIHEKKYMTQLRRELQKDLSYKIQRETDTANQLISNINIYSNNFLKQQQQYLINIEKNVHNMSPDTVLKRGYSITRLNNKAITNTDEIAEGDSVETLLFKGSFTSIIKNKSQTTQHD
ncbi:MAG: exodeoxyribonuclease VII large subunit [Bacteroidia bacterium]|nr:exodeoxyribonuclease VII large subunit [Bacteroidia bacterium]